jgi:hypothetical protein
MPEKAGSGEPAAPRFRRDGEWEVVPAICSLCYGPVVAAVFRANPNGPPVPFYFCPACDRLGGAMTG